jgi:GNAT superfamily N-acetyltransferase
MDPAHSAHAALHPANEIIRIVPSTADRADDLEALTDLVYGVQPGDDPGECLRAHHFRHHIALYPEGQYMALAFAHPADAGTVVGLTACMRIAFDPARPFIEPWFETISGGWLTRHDPDAPWMYGVESAVHPAYRGVGVGGRLTDMRFAVARALNLRGMVAGSTLTDLCKGGVGPEEYLRGVVEGRFIDGNLTKQMKKGFRPIALIPDYVNEECAQGWGAVVVWENPAYNPARPTLRALPPGAAPGAQQFAWAE